MKHLKSYKLFESRIVDLEDDVRDILLELEDEGFQIEISRISKDVEIDTEGYFCHNRTDVFLEVRVMRPWGSSDRVIPNSPTPPGGTYPGNIFIWREVKDAIIRLTEWYYSQSIHEPIDKETIYRTAGKIIKINNVSFKVEKNIPRCVAINLKPQTDDSYFNFLQSLKKIYNHFDMGIYLTALNDGKIEAGNILEC